MIKGYFLLFLSVFLTAGVFAATSSDSTQTPRSTLTLAAIYGNNANYYGQTAEQRLPYILTNASYRLKGGLYFSAGSYKLLNVGGSVISEFDISTGYEFNFSKKFSGSAGYTRSFFAKNSPLLQAANENTLSTSLAYDFGVFKTGLSGYYAFGTQNDFFLSFVTSKTLNLGSLGKKDFITLDPGIEIVGGTLHYLEEYIVRRDRQGVGGLLPPGPLNPYRDQYYTMTRNASNFDLLSYNANLALGYNRSNYLIETSWQLTALGKNISETGTKARSFFNLSFYYQF
ncbi:MAG: hypothetical protein WC380_10880 [Pedobacter sp.]|jgi:hypothetical protein